MNPIIQNDKEALKAGYLLSARGLAIVGFPLSLGVVVTAEWIVPILFGSGWQQAVFPLQALTLANIFVFINIPGHALVLARGHARLKFIWSLQISSMRLIAVLLGLWFGGLFGLVIAILLFRVVAVWPFYRLMVRSQLGPVFGEIARSIFPAALATGAMTLAVMWVMALLEDKTIAHLGAVVVFGAAFYIALILLFQGKELREFRAFRQ